MFSVSSRTGTDLCSLGSSDEKLSSEQTAQIWRVYTERRGAVCFIWILDKESENSLFCCCRSKKAMKYTVFRICNVHLHNSFSWYFNNADPPTWLQNKCWDYFHKLQTCWNFSYSAWSLVKFWHKNHRDHVLALVSLPQTQLEHVHSLYSIFFSPQKWLQ